MLFHYKFILFLFFYYDIIILLNFKKYFIQLIIII